MQSVLTAMLIAGVMLAGCSGAPAKAERSPALYSKDISKTAFSHPVEGLDDSQTDLFVTGRSFFHTPWVEAPSATTARDGLGPLFSANTCANCHKGNGAGVAVDGEGRLRRDVVLRLARHKRGMPDPVYGAQLSVNGTHGIAFEGMPVVRYTEIRSSYPDGTRYTLRVPTYGIEQLQYGALDPQTSISPRIAPALVGLGMIERIHASAILAGEDADDRDHDGISGRANRVYNPETKTVELGRFTWKASSPTVRFQSANAASNDMGLTSPLFPRENCTPAQTACLEAPKGRHAFDLPGQRLDAIDFYVTHLKIPAPRPFAKQAKAKALFGQLRCDRCHTPAFETLQGEAIAPFSDFLLHDMGEALADGVHDGLATGSEWRTPPLWGIGLQRTVGGEANFLHDGRARTIEEAILWHGGEAQASRDAFMALDADQREVITTYIGTI